ncbi:hypothetical protein ILYODFUR_000225 [Ilyodon furcidens]|uniref:Uncharacterized protein n=2 Tax=Goodeidae TaxID=28758 RepID=A0ABV0STU9_9TELE
MQPYCAVPRVRGQRHVRVRCGREWLSENNKSGLDVESELDYSREQLQAGEMLLFLPHLLSVGSGGGRIHASKNPPKRLEMCCYLRTDLGTKQGHKLGCTTASI